MHFVIYGFVAAVCLVSAVIFTEVFPKWFKLILAILGSASCGGACAILIRKIAELTSAFAKPELMLTFYICSAITLVLVIITKFIILKKVNKTA